ncbi:unnamed protein product [Didymodactylos carnosus]|uniref:Uncharacterized protein n=1 Tax=Didymodactylos carnosus TaxID=1234261 RepID=A0A814R4I6_9BILA|nr:unnamed protein product [Didymodactylos carnosus]CAF1128737.1 unnamed protein product [Didymodactylos carnosus]CAF3804591.1 unnamed protein product [Didymodactylos carnosus]CAF3892330.1 unnamed protein product [Didymodactylos carnosus]
MSYKRRMEMEDGNEGGYDQNRYATKKTIAEGSFEIALLITNAVQLKVLLGNMEKTTLWWVGIALGKPQRQRRLVSLNNFSLILSVILAAVNVVLNVIVVVDPNLLSPTNNTTKLKLT